MTQAVIANQDEGRENSKSLVHRLALIIVWLTLATGAFVFSEPAPVDMLSMGLVVLLPVVGLVRITDGLLAYLGAWLAISAAGMIALAGLPDVGPGAQYTAISIYLCVISFILAGFIAKNPEAHGRLVLSALTCGAIIAAAAGIVGYFGVTPRAAELFTKFSRASGTFKDPNVFGPFLVPGIIYAMHLALTRPFVRSIVPAIIAGVLTLALLLSFSRGAWLNLVVAVAIYGYVMFVTAPTDRQRLKLLLVALAGMAMVACILLAALNSESVSKLLSERASLTQKYDVGPEGRFGGQEKAVDLILENPLGIGAKVFARVHHHEEVHNVYLNMFLNAGWLGGLGYFCLVLATIVIGFRHGLKRSPVQPLFLIVYATFVANALEGAIIDTDHWRHFYWLMGLVWGFIAAPAACPMQPDRARIPAHRMARIVGDGADLRPRRPARIVRHSPRRSAKVIPLRPRPRSRNYRPRRAARIVARTA